MIKYFSPVKYNEQVYSCDMIRVSFSSDLPRFEKLAYFVNFECGGRPDVELFPFDTRFAHYKHLVVFKYDDDAVMKCGLGFNGATRDDSFRGFVEFNPNKVSEYSQFKKDYMFLRNHFGVYEVPRVDIALDIPARRENVFLRKDNRKYRLDLKSAADKTEYLGIRNNPGRVKVYNKALEQKLTCPLTRIEVTTEPTETDFLKHIPLVYDFGVTFQEAMKTDLNATDEVLLDLFLGAIVENRDSGMALFNRLSYVKRKKLEPYVLPDVTNVKFHSECVWQVLENVKKEFYLEV